MTEPTICLAVSTAEVDLLFAGADQRRLRALGAVVPAAEHEVAAVVPDDVGRAHDVLVTSWSTAPFDPAVLAGGRLRFAAHAAGSVRLLWPKEVLGRGLRLSQSAAAMAPAVAEMALTHTLVLLRHVHRMDRAMSAGMPWARARDQELGSALSSLTVGVVGLSRAGWHYAEMVRALGVRRLLVHDPYADQRQLSRLGAEPVGLTELCERCDVVAVHAPHTPETHHMIGVTELASIRDGAVLVNTARSRVVDEQALTAELRAGRLRAGLDVFDDEPLPVDSPLRGLPNVLLTPHWAGGTHEARLQQGRIVVDEIERFLTAAVLHHEVTLADYDRLA